MFSRAGFSDYRLIAWARISGHAAQLVLFPDAGELAWYFPVFDCFRWSFRAQCLIHPLSDWESDRPRSWLHQRTRAP